MIVLDTETFFTQPGFQVPIPVIATTYEPGQEPRLWQTWELGQCFEYCFRHDAILGHNLAFDMAVIAEWYPEFRPLIWRFYEEGRIKDTMLAQRIIEIQRGARGKLALPMVAARYGIQMSDKKDEEIQRIRLSFGELFHKHVDPKSREGQYALDDATVPFFIYERQRATGLVSDRDLADLARNAFWLHLMSAQGFRADPERLTKLEADLNAQLEVLLQLAQSMGFVRPNGSRNMKAIRQAILEAYGEQKAPYVDDNPLKNISTAREVLEDSGDEDLIQLASFAQLLSIRNKDIPLLRAAADHPAHSMFGFADTLRITSAKPNQQNMGKYGGVRECIVPRLGAFVLSDFGNLENVALAQLIWDVLGRHEMADKLNAGIDLHAEVGATILNMPYEYVVANKDVIESVGFARNAGKPANYGMAGGMKKPETFQRYARGSYKVTMDLETTKRVMEAWWRTAHDQVAWVEHQYGLEDVQLPNTDIVRRGVGPTIRCNTPFQKLGRDVAMEAGWELTRRQHLTGTFPARLTLFIHDEFVADCDPEAVTEVAKIQEEVMVEAAARVLPRMKMKVDTKALDRYSKEGKGKWQNGRLLLQKL